MNAAGSNVTGFPAGVVGCRLEPMAVPCDTRISVMRVEQPHERPLHDRMEPFWDIPDASLEAAHPGSRPTDGRAQTDTGRMGLRILQSALPLRRLSRFRALCWLHQAAATVAACSDPGTVESIPASCAATMSVATTTQSPPMCLAV